MARWCDYCVDKSGFFSTCYMCNVTGEEKDIPSGYKEKYCENWNKSGECPRYKDNIGKSNETGSSGFGCYITTATCEVLKKPDNDPILEKLRLYRKNVLQKDMKYANILKIYDRVGPIISDCIFFDSNRRDVSEGIYSRLEKITDIIDNGEYDRANQRYIMMTLRLVCLYGLQQVYKTKRDNNFGYGEGEFDITKAGHGEKMQKMLDL